MENFEYNKDDDGETEERVQVTKAICFNEEEIPSAILKTKRDLKESEIPPGYKKIDEEIVTKVYKIQGNRSKRRKYKSDFSRNILHSKYKPKTTYEAQNISNNFKNGKKKYFYEKYQFSPKNEDIFDFYSEYRAKNNINKNNINLRNSARSEELGIKYLNQMKTNHEYYITKNPFHIKKTINNSKDHYQRNNIKNYNIKNDYNYKYNFSDNNNENKNKKYNYSSYKVIYTRNNNSNNDYNNYGFNTYNRYNNQKYYNYNIYNNDNNKKEYYYSSNHYINNNHRDNNNYNSYKNNDKDYYSSSYINRESQIIEYNTKPQKYINYTPFNGGKIENYFENDVSQDGKYIVNIIFSKKIMNREDNIKIDNKNIEKEESDKERGKYKKNIHKKEIQHDE